MYKKDDLTVRNLTKLQKLVICMIYSENLTISETSYVLTISEYTVKRILWDITDKFVQQESVNESNNSNLNDTI